ncbi:MAG: SRPBCC family protein [Halomonadaceae bacterium]|nr:MAG: SRPBCC family protein [Halomonadaceae bacterium]
MAVQRIHIEHHFPYSVEAVFGFLSVHKNLEKVFFPAKIKRIKDGSDTVDGTGSVRRMRLPLAPAFEETVTEMQPNEKIVYRISKGSPLRNHQGTMVFSGTTGGCKLDYQMEFEGRFPLVGPVVKVALEQGIRQGLKRLRL